MPTPPRNTQHATRRLLHFGPAVLTAAAFAAYILILAHGLPALPRLGLLLTAQLAAQFTIALANDYYDAPYDAVAQPDKPIPAGFIARRTVGRLATGGATLTLLLALPLGPLVTLFTTLGLAAGLAYDAGLKRTRLSPLPFMLGFGLLPLWAAAGVGAPLAGPPLLCAALTALLVIPLHLADTLPDLAGDQAAGVRGLTHRLGLSRALRVCWATLLLGQMLAVLLALIVPFNWLLFGPTLTLTLALLLAAIWLYRQKGSAALAPMSGLIEAAALLTSLGWLAGAIFV